MLAGISVKGSGVFRGIIAAAAMLFARFRANKVRTNHYPDPITRDPYARPRSHTSTKRNSHRQGPPRLGRPPCDPGTITYHDKLVRHFGRREADRIGRAWQAAKKSGLNKDLEVLPF